MSADKKKILLQLDADSQPSTFDSVVAIDAGAEELLRHGDVSPDNVEPLVHGAMFTRGPKDLRSTAIFIGGSDVSAGEHLLEKVTSCFFGPMRVSVMLDANGSNTTAVAAILAAETHITWQQCNVLVLGGTGPVGRRIARLTAAMGAHVTLGSRQLARAGEACDAIRELLPDAEISPLATSERQGLVNSVQQAEVVFAAGAAGVQLLSKEEWQASSQLKVAIDLNAVPPAGLEGIAATDKDSLCGSIHGYGALGVGGLKMKIHKACIQKLFESNELVMDAEQILAVGRQLSQ